jgi:hypothetical protein
LADGPRLAEDALRKENTMLDMTMEFVLIRSLDTVEDDQLRALQARAADAMEEAMVQHRERYRELSISRWDRGGRYAEALRKLESETRSKLARITDGPLQDLRDRITHSRFRGDSKLKGQAETVLGSLEHDLQRVLRIVDDPSSAMRFIG